MSTRVFNVWWTQNTSSSGTLGLNIKNYVGSTMDCFLYAAEYGNWKEYRITNMRYNIQLNTNGTSNFCCLFNTEKTKIIGTFIVSDNYLKWACSSDIIIDGNSYDYSYAGFSNSLSSQQFTITYSDEIPVDQINFTIPPTSDYSSITLSQDGKSVTQNTNPVHSQSLIWPTSNGTSPSISIDINHATLGIRPAITSVPNVETYATVSINGVDTKYKLGTVIPDTDIPPNVFVDLSIQSTAPEITIDYNNTSAPVITNTPTGG